ncbi:MAG: protein TolQ [Candidatus Tectomicrobia bacterium]|nr:protein TolQ [Candidatus Tectomicrobia bacterium]
MAFFIDSIRGSAFELVLQAGPIVKLVLILLVGFSVVSWGIIFQKLRMIRKAQKDSERFLDIFWSGVNLSAVYSACRNMEASPLARVFLAGYLELENLQRDGIELNSESYSGDLTTISTKPTGFDNISRTLRAAMTLEISKLERHLPFLATTGSTTPFIGLFGTVWGIMDSFRNIGARGSASLAVVAPGISEALIATAVGLVAAIPAVVAYNHFMNRVRLLSLEMENFTSEFLNLLSRTIASTEPRGTREGSRPSPQRRS